MNILFLATKAPWPAVDGGRLLMQTTLEELTAQGHRVTVVAPTEETGQGLQLVETALSRFCEPVLVSSRPTSAGASLWASRLKGRPLSIQRHRHPAVLERVSELLDRRSFDLVHVEQLQALYAAEPALDRGLPVVFRAQNVESDLWKGTARATPLWSPWHWLGKSEARRLARWEGHGVGRATVTVALTEEDASRLRQLSSGTREVRVVRVPFPAELPSADSPLPGAPAVVVLGSAGWLPNQDGVEWLLRDLWPTVVEALPGARLHVFGNPGDWPQRYPAPEITYHPFPKESRTAFPPGSILLVPLRIASGVRMKILEAWARGIPVVANPTAAAGLAAEDGRELRIFHDAATLADALEALQDDPSQRQQLIENGRQALRQRHDRRGVIDALLATYGSCRHR